MNSNNENNLEMSSKFSETEEIDIDFFLQTIIRKRLLIGFTTLTTIILSIVYAYLKKPVWQGHFQIVLTNKQNITLTNSSVFENQPALRTFLGNSRELTKIKTEVKVLESPSVLMPVFEYVKQQKSQLANNDVDMNFFDWKNNNLSVNLERGTSVLDITYRDTDKNLVLPVIELISKKYQEYSGRDREKGLREGLIYLDNELRKFRAKSSESFKKAQEFGTKYDLNIINLELEDSESAKDVKQSASFIESEKIRVEAANEIRQIDEQIQQLLNLSNDPEAVLYQGNLIPSLAEDPIFATLKKLQINLADYRTYLNEEDDLIVELKRKRGLITELVKKQTLGYLKAQKLFLQSKLKAAERPEGVITEFKELIRSANRDKLTLVTLEEERHLLALEKSRNKEPWELISKPTVFDEPVEPVKSRIAIMGLFLGIILSAILSKLQDKNSDIVYSFNQFKFLIRSKNILRVSRKDNNDYKEDIELLIVSLLDKSKISTLAFIELTENKCQKIQTFKKSFKKKFDKINFIEISDILNIKNVENLILIVSSGSTKKSQIIELNEKLDLLDKKLLGWIYMN